MNDRAPKGMGPYQVKERTKGGRKVWRITYTETVRDEDGNAILNIESGQPVRKYIRAEVARERFGSAERAFGADAGTGDSSLLGRQGDGLLQ